MTNDRERYNILWLEDNCEAFVALLSETKKTLNAKIYTTNAFETAKELSVTNAIDLFILDIELEGERYTGIQFAEWIRAHEAYANAPILFVSMHSHFSYRVLNRHRNCSFLKKPFQTDDFILQCGVLLGIDKYFQLFYQDSIITIPVSKQTQIEIHPQNISFIDINNGQLSIQYTDGKLEHFICSSGTFKSLVEQIKKDPGNVLRQIHRSIIVNVDQIKCVETQKKVGFVLLFNDPTPKPLGIRFRRNISDLIKTIKDDLNE